MDKKKTLTTNTTLPITKLYFLYKIYPISIRVKVLIKIDICWGILLMVRIFEINSYDKYAIKIPAKLIRMLYNLSFNLLNLLSLLIHNKNRLIDNLSLLIYIPFCLSYISRKCAKKDRISRPEL